MTMAMTMTKAAANRWWIYQRERFPLLAYALLAAVLACSVSGFSTIASGATMPPNAANVVAAAIGVFLFFVLMRVADEFKDAEDDRRYRPYRAVPRGLVTLDELARVGVAAAITQFALAWLVDPRLLWLLALAWIYFALMSAEFFAPFWLKARPLAYLASHVPLIGLITLYASAHEWLPSGSGPPPRLGWVLVASVLFGAMLEIARKIRAPEDEEAGVDSYTRVWGKRTAVLAWLGAFAPAGACTLVAADFVGTSTVLGIAFAALGLTALIVASRFLHEPTGARAKRAEQLTAVITLVAYAGLGPLAYVMR